MAAPACRHFFSPGGCRNGDSCRFSHFVAERPAAPISFESGPLGLVESGAAPAYALDVECVATGPTHNDRAVAQVGLVDQNLQVVLNVYVKPRAKVMSYLTPLTGLNADILDSRGVSLEEASEILRQFLPSSAILVGMNIGQDAKWLGLTSPDDFCELLDLAALFRVWDDSKKRFHYFSQDHVARTWIGHKRTEGQSHDAVGDSVISMSLLHEYIRVKRDPHLLAQLRQQTLQAKRLPSFSALNPVFEGVCQGNRRTCTCGSPHFS